MSILFRFLSHLGNHRALSRVPCVIYQVLIIYFIHSSIYKSIPISQFIPLPPPPPWQPSVYSLLLCFCFSFATKFIYTIFLASTYKQYYMIFLFLFLTISLCMTVSRSIHGKYRSMEQDKKSRDKPRHVGPQFPDLGSNPCPLQ